MVVAHERAATDLAVPVYKRGTLPINKIVETTESPVPIPERFAVPEMEESDDSTLAIIFIPRLLLRCF